MFKKAIISIVIVSSLSGFAVTQANAGELKYSRADLENCNNGDALSWGRYGKCVGVLQFFLNKVDGANIDVDKSFKGQTYKALNDYKDRRNIGGTRGWAGKGTFSTLLADYDRKVQKEFDRNRNGGRPY